MSVRPAALVQSPGLKVQRRCSIKDNIVRSFVLSIFVRLFFLSFFPSFYRSFVHSFVCLFVRTFVRLFVRFLFWSLFSRSLVRSVARPLFSFVCFLSVPLFVRSFIPAFLQIARLFTHIIVIGWFLIPSLPPHHSWNGSMFLIETTIQRSARIAELLFINETHTLIFSLPFPSETRVSGNNEHPSSSTNYKKDKAIKLKKCIAP